MPRGLSQERAQRIWDGAVGAAYLMERARLLATGNYDEDAPNFRALVAECAAERASEAVTALRERERRNRSKR